MKKLIVDLDGTLTLEDSKDYAKVSPRKELVDRLRQYQKEGFSIVIATARNMRSFDGNVGKINVHTLPVIMDWLDEHNIPYDEVIVGKPWCGFEGFYIDDKSIRPSEFINMSYDEIQALLAQEKE